MLKIVVSNKRMLELTRECLVSDMVLAGRKDQK